MFFSFNPCKTYLFIFSPYNMRKVVFDLIVQLFVPINFVGYKTNTVAITLTFPFLTLNSCKDHVYGLYGHDLNLELPGIDL